MGSLEALEPRVLLAGDLLISEVVASNNTGLNDEDGDTSDWIEVLNVSTSTLNLDGWSLTDDANTLAKWRFPSRELPAGQSTVVFASGKNRMGSELHTNFQLARGGEFLAVVKPDGTISDQYTPYPEQFADVSYGPQQETVTTPLVGPGASARILLPASPAQDIATATWTATNFNDSAWRSGKLGAGYDTNPQDGDFGSLIDAGGNLAAMRGQTSSAYVRTTFDIPGGTIPDFNTMTLTMNHDDGFVAYLNGTEVARRNAPETLKWDSVATQQWGGILQQRQYANFVTGDDQEDFMLQGGASWFFDRLHLTANQPNQTAAAWTREAIPFSSDYSFSTFMALDVYDSAGTPRDGDGRGGEGLAFVLQSGGNTRLGGGTEVPALENTGMNYVAIEFDTFQNLLSALDAGQDLPTHIGISTSVDGSIARAAVERFNAGRVAENIRYAWIEYNGVTDQMDVYFSTTNAQPGLPTLSATVDLAALFDGQPSLWAGWTAVTSAAINAHDVLQWQFTAGAGELGLLPIQYDLSQHLGLLKPTNNVLAIHGLNLDKNDGDFLLAPQLSAAETLLTDRAYFVRPTPGDVNGAGGAPPASDVTFSVNTRVFVEPFTVTISAASPNAVIRYTTDGSNPNETSTLYSGPIQITETTRIRARAFQPNRAPGAMSTVGYTQLDTSLASFENGQPFHSNLPLMIFDSNRGRADTNSACLVPVTAIFIPTGQDGRSRILGEPEFAGWAGMHIRGQSSEGWPKKNYALEIWEQGPWEDVVGACKITTREVPGTVDPSEGVDQSVSIFGLPPESDWVLHAPYSDKTQLNNYLSFNWSNEMGLYAPRTKLVEVFVNDNGGPLDLARDYRGTYVLMEKIKIDENRVNITPLTRADNSEPEITGGYIWKLDKDGVRDVNFRTARGHNRKLVEPDWNDFTEAQRQWLINYNNEFEAALFGANFRDPVEGYAKYIDVDSWIDTWILVEMTKQIDGFRLSTYYYKDRGGKIKQGPPWDFNLALVNANYLKGAYPAGWYKDGISGNDYPYWDRLFEDPNFYQRLVDRWQELRQTIFTTENMLADIDAAVNLISNGNPNYEKPAAGEPSNPIARNVARWGERYFTTYHWPNCYFGVDDCPRPSPLVSDTNPTGRPQSYADYIFLMKDFVERRFAWMDSQFLAHPTISPAGGKVSAPANVTLQGGGTGTIIYTTNGTDPRGYVAGALDEVIMPFDAQANVLVPTVLSPFANALVQSCKGSPLANPNACLMSPYYTLGTHGESWISGPLPVGFDDGTNFTSFIQTDIKGVMDNLNQSAYIRIPFQVTAEQKARMGQLALEMRYDDGFVAYLWSDQLNLPVEIARSQAPGTAQTVPIDPLPVNSQSTRSHSNRLAVDFEKFDVTNAIQYLREGTNYLIIHGLNERITSHDFLMGPQLVAKRKLSGLPEGVYEYSGPITVNKNTRIVARTYDPLTELWSGTVTATYVTEEPRIAITELNYHPYAPTASEMSAGFTDRDQFEFLEVQNIGPRATNLIGSHFVSGVDYEFPSVDLAPGQFGVIVSNPAAFQARYGATIPIIGRYEGNLANDGEPLTLVSPLGTTLVDVDFNDQGLWPARADGFGATLELANPLATPAEQLGKHYRWRGSTQLGGSPGRAGAAPLGIVINEVLANTDAPDPQSDAIELLNTSTAPINVSGWYLSDSGFAPLKYRLPDNTVIGPGQYLVVSETQFNPTPNNPAANHFALSGARGDDVWLVVADGTGGVASFVDDVHFGATRVGESLGRAPNATGRLAPMTRNTLGSENALPRVGPIVFSEINYNPAQPSAAALAIDPSLERDDLEFIEVHNPTGSAVDLTNWQIRGGAEFDFAPGTLLAPGGAMIVVSFDPADPANAKRLAALRANYGLDASVKVVGGYLGKMSNGGERLQLERPDSAQDNLIPRIMEDEVIYDDLVPWPTSADGQGKTLTRTSMTAWGNAPTSWSAANPSPGVTVPSGPFVPQPGDSNMDRQFDQRDLVLVLQGGKYGTGQPATFAQGDWNGDGVFNQLDIVAALQTGNYLRGPYAAVGPSDINGSLAKAQEDADVAATDVLFSGLTKFRLI